MVSDWFVGYEIVLAMAIFVSSWPLGISIALVSLIRIALVTSWQLVMHLTAAISLISLVIIAVLYHEPSYTESEEKERPAKQGVSRSEAWLVVLAGLIWSLFNVGFVILPSFAPEFLISTGYSASLASSLVSTVTWIVIPSLIVGGYIAEKIGHANITLVACFSSIGAALILLTLSPHPLTLFIALGFLFGPPAGVIMALPNEILRAENRGPGMGIFYTSYYAGMATLPTTAGFLQDVTERPGTPLIFGGSLFFVMIIILGLFRYFQRSACKCSLV
jgi:cyanate permease